MSYISDNNLDDLFKRASDKYPLRTDGADWDRLAGDLDREPSLILPPAKKGDNRRRRRLLWLFLLLPLAGIGYFVFQHGNSSVVNASVHSVGGTGTKTAGAAESKNADGTISGQTEGKTNDQTKEQAFNQTEKDKSISEPTDRGGGDGAGRTGSNSPGLSGQIRPNNAGITGRNASASGTNPGASGTNAGTSGRNHGVVADAASKDGEQTDYGKGNGSAKWTARDAEGRLVSLKTVPTSGGISLNIPAPARDKNIQAKDTTKPTTKKQKDRQSSMYIGIIAAPDLSTVKFQSIKGTGVTAGILLGYNFNKRLALETGIYLDRKKYYSDGEYFNTKGITGYFGGKLNNVDGSCNMFEIPINLRYNLGGGKRMKWFATGGLSTYLMTRESYNYNLSYAWGDYNGFTAYSKPSQNWLSVINLSIGFEQKLGKIGELRVEPYWRIPTSGMGQGSLPIMSAGLNIGITHKLW